MKWSWIDDRWSPWGANAFDFGQKNHSNKILTTIDLIIDLRAVLV